jgi:hypothetical protein
MMIELDLFKTIVALACLGSCLYSLHRGWAQAAGWLGLLSFFAVLGVASVH